MDDKFRALIADARSLSVMIRSDLDDLMAGRETPDRGAGLEAALARASAMQRCLELARTHAKFKRINLKPRIPFRPNPPSTDDVAF